MAWSRSLGGRGRAGLTLVALLVAQACGDRSGGSRSLVVLGDSVASGEGIYYGFQYDPATGLWNGPADPDPAWDPPYPLCHQSRFAYGHLIANALDAKLASFACSGASYANGIAAPQLDGGVTLRPAQFGDFATRTDLNPDYDAAAPDAVVVTLGANDVKFVQIITACVLGTALGTQDLESAARRGENLGAAVDRQIRDNREALLAMLAGSPSGRPAAPSAAAARVCTQQNPGTVVETNFFDQLPLLQQHYQTLLAGIRARGVAAGKVPRVVMTTYHVPLPATAPATPCPDLLTLDQDQLTYLRSLEDMLADLIVSTAAGLDGVAVAEIRPALAGHEWCTSDPWTYGLSIEIRNLGNPAPFHPTREGQAAIARLVRPVVEEALRERPAT